MGRWTLLGWRWGKEVPGPLKFCCVFLCVCVAAAETLVVENVSREPLKVLMNDNVILPCKFSGYGSTVLDLRNVGIRWMRIIGNKETHVYTFNGATGGHSCQRPGAAMLEGEIKEGNAALHLPQIRFEEEGNYKCEVFITPSKAEGTVSLEVSAQPTTFLSSTEVEVKIGEEKSVLCHIDRFYPLQLSVIWEAFSKSTGKYEVIEKDTCTGYPEENPDGTFNVTSILRLQPSLEDNQNAYKCIVGHRSLSSLLELKTTLTVKEPETSSGKILGAVFGTILAFILWSVINYFIYHTYFRKVPDVQEHREVELCLDVPDHSLPTREVPVPPKLSDIEEPPKILHKKSVVLTCPVNGFKPKPLTITWLRTTHNEKEELLVEYDLDKKELNISSDKYAHTSNENGFADGTFHILSVLIFAPMVEADNEVNIICRIHHHATSKTDHKMFTLSVKAPPTLDAIQAVPEIPCTEGSLTLSCRIHSFFPKVLEVTWYKDEAEMSEMINNSDVTSGPDELCSCTSSITFTPRKEDIGMIFRCRVTHDSLMNDKDEMIPRESTWKLQDLIRYPKPLKVVCDPVVPEQGKSFTLSCTVEDYYPPDCTVKWLRGFEPISNVELEEPQVFEATDLYRRKSQITCTPTNDDHNVEFSVEVNHCNRVLREKYCMNLKGFPVVSDISCNAVNAVYGEPLVLSCQVRGCASEDVTVTWFDKDITILKGITSKDPPPEATDPTIRLHCLEIIPSALHYNAGFVFEVKHKNLTKAIKKHKYLPLEAQPPVLSDITVTPAEPEVNKILQMTIHVSNFSPKDIQVKWYKNWTELPMKMFPCSEPHIGENYLCVCTSTAEFCPNPSDNGIQIRCEVTHSTTKKVLEKRFKLNLKGSDSELKEEAT